MRVLISIWYVYSLIYILAIVAIELPFTRNRIYHILNNKHKEFRYEGYSSYYRNYKRRILYYIKYYFQCPYLLVRQVLRINKSGNSKGDKCANNLSPYPIQVEPPKRSQCLCHHSNTSMNKRGSQPKENDTSRSVSLEQATYLPEVQIIDPPITWEQYLRLQERRRRNKELALRNAKRNYLLRGFILCETHRGKRGEPRKYYGEPQNKSYKYTCPVGSCAHPHFNGPQLEKSVKQLTRSLLSLESHDFYERIADRDNKKGLQDSLKHELKSLEIKHNRNINSETELEHRNLTGRENPEVYRRLKGRYQAERIWIEERIQAINEEMAQLNREAEAIGSLQKIKDRCFGRIDELTDDEWRELFVALNLVIPIGEYAELGSADIRLFSPDVTISYFHGKRDFKELQKRQPEPADVEVRIGLPLGESEEVVSNIVFTRPLFNSSPP